MAVSNISFVLSYTDAGLHAKGRGEAYKQYVNYLIRTTQAREGSVEAYARGYGDFLQAPLQPLQDNLQNATYETFEQDPVKYANYEEAIYRALVDRVGMDHLYFFFQQSVCQTYISVFCVSGAGRGPLIARALAALERASRKSYTLYAIEKNPSAYLLLQQTRGIHHNLHRCDKHVAVPRLPAQHALDVPARTATRASPDCRRRRRSGLG